MFLSGASLQFCGFFSLWSTQQGKREQKLPCYYFFFKFKWGKFNTNCLQNGKHSQHNCFRHKMSDFCATNESQWSGESFFWGLSHFVTVFQSIYVGVMKQCIKKENSLGLFWFEDRVFSSWTVRNLCFLWQFFFSETVSLTQRCCPPTRYSFHWWLGGSSVGDQACWSQ